MFDTVTVSSASIFAPKNKIDIVWSCKVVLNFFVHMFFQKTTTTLSEFGVTEYAHTSAAAQTAGLVEAEGCGLSRRARQRKNQRAKHAAALSRTTQTQTVYSKTTNNAGVKKTRRGVRAGRFSVFNLHEPHCQSVLTCHGSTKLYDAQGKPIGYFFKSFFTEQEQMVLDSEMELLLQARKVLQNEKSRHNGKKVSLGFCGSYRSYAYLLKATHEPAAVRFIKSTQHLYTKVSALHATLPNTGNNILKQFMKQLPCKTFGDFPTAHINVDASTRPHKDACDEPGVMAALIYSGNFSGGAFVINGHNVRLPVQPGDLLFINAKEYLHSAEEFKGKRRSVVLFMNHNLYTKYSKSEYVQCDLKCANFANKIQSD